MNAVGATLQLQAILLTLRVLHLQEVGLRPLPAIHHRRSR